MKQLLQFSRTYIVFVFIFSFFIISFGCVEKANPVGANLLPGKDAQILKTDTLYSTGQYTQYVPDNNSGGDRFFVGNYGSLSSLGFLQFQLFADTIFGRPILSAYVRLKVISHQGDSLAALSFVPYRMLTPFSGDSLTYDSLQSNPAFYYDPTPMGKIFSRSHINDTEYIVFSLDTAVVRYWFTSLADTINYGMLLMPTNSSVIKGFSTYSAADSTISPQLTVTWLDTLGLIQTFTDTVSTSRSLAYIDSTSLNSNKKMLYVLSGVAYRGVLAFDASRLPSPCIINSAILKLSQNKQLTELSGYVPDSLMSTQMYDDGSLQNIYSTSTDSISSAGTPGHPHVTYYFDVRTPTQSWVENYSKQPRIQIVGYNESSSFDLHVMYGSDTSLSNQLRPRIIVTYSTK